MMRAHTEALLEGLQARGIKLGLGKVRDLLTELGPLPPRVRVVQVGGTNGKGSVAHGIEAIARAQGLRTGLFTSPHLVCPTERIRIEGRPMAEEEFDRRVADLARRIEVWSGARPEIGQVTYFEFLFALALEAFAGVDLAILEVGMGGRLDATTAHRADVTCITSVSMDHEAYLGSDLGSIAGEKAGIIRGGVPVIVGPMADQAWSVVRDRADEMGAPMTRVGAQEGIGNGMWGPHQRVNAALSMATAVALGLGGDARARAALARVTVPARCERIRGVPEILLDGCHNPAGARALDRVLWAHPARGATDLLISVGRDKDAPAIVEPLLPHVRSTMATAYSGGCGPLPAGPLPAGDMARVVADLGGRVEEVPTPAEALRRVRERASDGDRLLVAGSLFLAGDVRRQLGPGEVR